MLTDLECGENFTPYNFQLMGTSYAFPIFFAIQLMICILSMTKASGELKVTASGCSKHFVSDSFSTCERAYILNILGTHQTHKPAIQIIYSEESWLKWSLNALF